MTPFNLKQRLYQRLAVSNNVTIGRGFHVGPGSRIWAPTSLAIGDDVYIGKWCTVETDGVVGSGCLIANNVGVIGRRDHAIRQLGRPISRAQWVGDDDAHNLRTIVSIGQDVWIGFGAIVLAPAAIGRGAVIASGAVVIDDVAPYSIVAGNPASVIGRRFDPKDAELHERQLRRDWGQEYSAGNRELGPPESAPSSDGYEP